MLLHVPIKPITLNHSHGFNSKTKRVFKVDNTDQWRAEFRLHLNMYFRKEIKDFASRFNPNEHYIYFKLIFFIDRLLTKATKNNPSHLAKKYDRCNIPKVPTDVLFDMLGIDDSSICDGPIKRFNWHSNHIFMSLDILPLEFLIRNGEEEFEHMQTVLNASKGYTVHGHRK